LRISAPGKEITAIPWPREFDFAAPADRVIGRGGIGARLKNFVVTDAGASGLNRPITQPETACQGMSACAETIDALFQWPGKSPGGKKLPPTWRRCEIFLDFFENRI
jgi:hypothetical protein